MKIFEFIRKQSEGSFGFMFLCALIYALLMLVPVVVFVESNFSDTMIDYFNNEYDEELGCYIEDYELYCNKDYFEAADGNLVIDLNFDEETYTIVGDGILLTKDTLYANNEEFTYETLLKTFGYESTDVNKEDISKFVENALPIITTVIYVAMFIGTYMGFFLAAAIWAGIMVLLSKWILKKEIPYGQSFKIFGYVTLIYGILNLITNLIFGFTIAGFLAENILFSGFIFNSSIYLGLYYLVLKEKK